MDRPASSRASAIVLEAELPFRIGGSRVDPLSHSVEIDGQPERLQPQNLKVLIALVRQKGEVVTRAQLVNSCWNGRVIGDDVINHAISALRAVANRAGGFSIETVPKSGYRLIEEPTRFTGRQKRITAFAIGVLVLVFGAALFLVTSGSQGDPPKPRMAILPFDGASDPDARQLAIATRDSLSSALSKGNFSVTLLDSLPVATASSLDLVTSGSVIRSGTSARATVRVEEVASRVVVYSRRFEASGDDIAVLPDRIGAQVAAILSWTGALMALDRRSPLESEIKSAVLEQLALNIEEADSLRAYQMIRGIAPQAPDSAIVQLSLAVSTARVLSALPANERAEAVRIGRLASERAHELAPEFGDTHIGWCLLRSPASMLQCEARLQRAIRIDPSSSYVPGYLSGLYQNAGRMGDAMKLADLSLANDPYKPAKLARKIRLLEANRKSLEAERLYDSSLRWWPGNRRLAASRLSGMIDSGNYPGIKAFLASAGDARSALDPGPAVQLLSALPSRDLREARQACANDTLLPLTLRLCMVILADLGDADQAFIIAEHLYPAIRSPHAWDRDRVWLDNPDGYSSAILSAPAAKTLRADPRFLVLARTQGLLAYWQSGKPPDFCSKAREPVCSKIFR